MSQKKQEKRNLIFGEPGNIIQIILLLLTLLSFCETQKSTKAAQESSKSAQEAVMLQRQQYEELKLQDSLQSIKDAEKQKKDIELIEKQISALQEQANVLKSGIQSTEIAQKPYVDIVQFGFHQLENSTFLCQYKAVNVGIRPMVLKETKLYIFDENIKYEGAIPFPSNTLLVNEKAVTQKLNHIIDSVEYSILSKEQVLNLQERYYYIKCIYYDPFLKQTFNTASTPFIFKWAKRPNLFSTQVGLAKYIGFELCSNLEEEKIMAQIAKLK